MPSSRRTLPTTKSEPRRRPARPWYEYGVDRAVAFGVSAGSRPLSTGRGSRVDALSLHASRRFRLAPRPVCGRAFGVGSRGAPSAGDHGEARPAKQEEKDRRLRYGDRAGFRYRRRKKGSRVGRREYRSQAGRVGRQACDGNQCRRCRGRRGYGLPGHLFDGVSDGAVGRRGGHQNDARRDHQAPGGP